MRGYGIRPNEKGAVLIIVLIFLLVFTMILTSNSEDIIVNLKMQHAIERHFLVLLRAQASMRQAVLSLEGQSVDLPDSRILSHTHIKNIKADTCGDQTVKIISQAEEDGDTVILNSEDIFARVPREKGCPKIPLHRCLWWAEVRS